MYRVALRSDVALAPLDLDHAAQMYRWMTDHELRDNVGVRREPSIEETVRWIVQAHNDPATQPFAIVVDTTHVGNVVLDHIGLDGESARVSLYIGEAPYRNIGVGTTGLFLALARGFKHVGLRTIWLTVHEKNHRALRTYHRLGFRITRTILDDFQFQGRYIAAHRMELQHREFGTCHPQAEGQY